MKELVKKTLNMLNAPDVQFGDVRVTVTDNENIFFERGFLKGAASEIAATSIGVRVLIGGTWGFASTSDMSSTSIEKIVKEAVQNARLGARFKNSPIEYKPVDGIVASYHFDPIKDPFKIPLKEKVSYLGEIASKMGKLDGIVHSIVHTHFYKQYKVYGNTEGTLVDTTVYDARPSMMVSAADQNGFQTRTFPGHMPAQRGGFEVLEKLDFINNIDKIAEEAKELLTAPRVTEDQADIIINNGHLALQLHESVGHATEADRMFGMEISYAGKTFVKENMLGNFKYGSDIVNIYTDASDKRGIGYHPVDDDGIPSKRVDIIKNGVLVDLQTSRYTAAELGLEPSSNMMATHASEFPLIRMSNICIAPGKGSLADLIKDTENGYLLDYTKTWSIDDNRNNFQFTTEIGWKIENGEIKHIVKEPTYFGITKDFWNSCDRICGPEEWGFYGTFYCGKGEPGQVMHLSHGVAPMRFKNVKMLPGN